MTEIEWLECTQPSLMLDYLEGKASGRKLRLFAAMACRQVCQLMDERCWKAIEVLEEYAEGIGSITRSNTAAENALLSLQRCERFSQVLYAQARHRWPNLPVSYAQVFYEATRHAVSAVYHAACGNMTETVEHVFFDLYVLNFLYTNVPNETRSERAERCAELACRRLTFLLHEYFGNPFKGHSIEPAWLAWNDRIIEKLADRIYKEQDFNQLPILADALEEAGCDNIEILNHLRGARPHVQGCWALDLVLGRK